MRFTGKNIKMIKVLFLIDSLTGGGAEKVLQTLVNNLDQNRFQITVQTIDHTDPGDFLSPGIRYKSINRALTPLGKRIFSCWLRLCAQLKWIYPLYIRGNYDVEVAYLECGPTKFLWGSSMRDILKLAWVHCDLHRRGIPATARLRRIYQSYDRVVCVSESVRESFVRVFGSEPPACVLHNVNDEILIRTRAEAFVPSMPDVFTFVCVGRLSKEKGLDRLLQACAQLEKMGEVFRLLILGDGPEREKLRTLRNQLRLENHITFLGYQENPYPYMKAADCILCSSYYEGMSTVVTEALILGKPVLTTRCAGMEELLGDSEYGLIVENSSGGIFRGMHTFLANPSLCQHYSNAAAQRSHLFSKTAIVEQTEQFLISELRKKRSNL